MRIFFIDRLALTLMADSATEIRSGMKNKVFPCVCTIREFLVGHPYIIHTKMACLTPVDAAQLIQCDLPDSNVHPFG
jgi:hypothetical protein